MPITNTDHKADILSNWIDIRNAPLTGTIERVGKKSEINTTPLSFDIETTNEPNTQTAYMYIWQMGISGKAYFGRTWESFFQALEMLRNRLTGTLIIAVHNLSFEAQFLLPRLQKAGLLQEVFAKAEREPLYILLKNDIKFIDTMALSNMSLAALASNYCQTQKLVGDLNYSKMRNSNTPLTDEEKAYCANDVIILCEYMQKLHERFTKQGEKIPLTSTGIVRRALQKSVSSKEFKSVRARTKTLYPESAEAYNFTMRYLFRGGFCHAQTAICGEIISDVKSHDLKSAYPAEMAHRKYPMTPFITEEPEKFENVIKWKACIFVAKFRNITATTAHVIESRHKIINFVNGEFENGRLFHADEMTVFLTDVDYSIYKMFYKWDEMEILQLKTALKQPLPKYLLYCLFKAYEKKETVGKLYKANPTDELRAAYMDSKAQLNSFYGMCVSRLNLDEFVYDENGWNVQPGDSYEKCISTSLLSPYWGIYITAYTRLTICTAIYHLGDEALYSDTDSIKNVYNGNYFDKFNDEIIETNRLMCKKYELDFDVFKKLGIFDFEGTYKRFKTLGAKRYLTEEPDKSGNLICSATVAGLPKRTFREFAEKVGNDVAFDKFTNSMFFDISGKNAHKYTDSPVSAIIDGERMEELSCCYIYSVSFKLSLETSFLNAIVAKRNLVKE